MTKYLVTKDTDSIHEIEIERETTQSVFYSGGRRESKVSYYSTYFDTWEEAFGKLAYRLRNRIEEGINAQDKLKRLEKEKELRAVGE